MIAPAVTELAGVTGTAAACALLGKPRATHYRQQQPAQSRPRAPRPAPPNALSDPERAAVLGDAAG